MNKKVLIVDDDQDIREIIKIELTNDGFQVTEASNGKSAVEIAKKEKPDLITLDIMMPGIDGLETAKLLKENPETKDIPIIILSVLAQDKKEYIQGIADYVSKPFKPDDLLSRIKHTLNETTNHKNILVVDDEPDVIDIITICLKDKNFSIVGAKDGQEALEKLKIFTPDLIITDIGMPRINGFELVKQLKKNPKFNKIPVIILTGTFITKDDKNYGIVLGASRYLTKPFTIDTLVKDIEDSL